VKSLEWDHLAAVAEVRERIWTHLTPTAVEHELLLEAGRLLQLSDQDILSLARVQFMISPEVGTMLSDLPRLLRRLATTTLLEEERSPERVQGPIQWPATFAARLTTGQPHLYVTAPARRAYQTPENELLAFTLNQIMSVGARIGWSESSGLGATISGRVGQAQRWHSHRALSTIDPVRPSSRSLSRIRLGRNSRRYGSVIEAFDLWQRLLGRLDINSIRDLIENRALVTADEPTLFEILCTFRVLDTLTGLGWSGDRLRVFRGGLTQRLRRGTETLTVWYQEVPPALSAGSRYTQIQADHHFPSLGSLLPDMVLRRVNGSEQTWLLIEDKLGEKRTVGSSARAALLDLLAYRTAFYAALASQRTYGLGIAWGAELEPATNSDIMLATPDRIAIALEAFAGT
jgi:hypothetical protein